jgi:hypothetical protein
MYDVIMGIPNDDISNVFIKFTWLKVISDYEHYVPLNLPKSLEIESLAIGDVIDSFW